MPLFGIPMIEHVRRRALLAGCLDEVCVATCDAEVADAVRAHGGEVVMTASTHRNGTTRVAEAVANRDCTHVVLLQGDEPLLLPRHVSELVQRIQHEPTVDAWNATGPIEEPSELDRHSFVKCAIGTAGNILYCFRRTPCYSDFETQRTFIRKILGLIAYRADILRKVVALPSTPIEEAELIEQIRIIANGLQLRSVAVTPSLPSINQPDEVDAVLDCASNDVEQREILARVLAWDGTGDHR